MTRLYVCVLGEVEEGGFFCGGGGGGGVSD